MVLVLGGEEARCSGPGGMPRRRRFAQLGGLDNVPDETTILNFRRLLETHGLAARMLEAINAHLAREGQSLRAGTIVDATLIAAPSSTKNADHARDPEMHQTKKGNQWYFGRRRTFAWMNFPGRCTTCVARPPTSPASR
ncbi:IS1479 transposase-like protein [Xanthomonas arboricola pv. fragariae]|nr:IS1479 transposase-like protein [Xanthomonas arboricola pv. fragariae]